MSSRSSSSSRSRSSSSSPSSSRKASSGSPLAQVCALRSLASERCRPWADTGLLDMAVVRCRAVRGASHLPLSLASAAGLLTAHCCEPCTSTSAGPWMATCCHLSFQPAITSSVTAMTGTRQSSQSLYQGPPEAAGCTDMRNPLSMIKKPPQLSQAKREAPARALKGLEDAAAAAQDCIWQRVRTVQLTGHASKAQTSSARGAHDAAGPSGGAVQVL